MAVNFLDMIGQTVSFDVYPSTIIGTNYKNVIIRGIVDHAGVTTFSPAVMHANVFPTMPNGTTVDDFRKYNYLRLELANKKVAFVGIPWIITNTVKVISNQNLVITIPNFGSHENQEFIKRMLLNNSIDDFTMDTQ